MHQVKALIPAIRTRMTGSRAGLVSQRPSSVGAISNHVAPTIPNGGFFTHLPVAWRDVCDNDANADLYPFTALISQCNDWENVQPGWL